MTKNKIDYETILACKAGDSDALNRVLTHYDRMINAAASRTVKDEHGQETVVIDQEVKQNIQQTLMLQIFLKYDHLAEPPKEQRNPAKRKNKDT